MVLDRFANTLCNGHRTAHAGFDQDNGVLVASVTNNRIFFTHHIFKQDPHIAPKEPAADEVPVIIIHFLEEVDVDK